MECVWKYLVSNPMECKFAISAENNNLKKNLKIKVVWEHLEISSQN